ncbi:MAG: cob(I)yrinic acid a,c-diamide adenosyltransferase [Spirochaetales bacterium]|nr:cob(I)yrinic acid a,c-diamide adenosyltransferase [Spirochaetales bacterium]
MVLIYTGDGKGKTSAAVGQAVRALGHDAKVAFVQFIKQDPGLLDSGEARILRNLGVRWESFGAGFTWVEGNEEKNRILATEGWETVKRWAMSGSYHLIVLDEFTYPLSFGYLDLGEVVSFIVEHKDDEKFPHLVITGRGAPEALIAAADMVSDVGEVKHHLADTGIAAQPMIEF